jgi:hypothetical protein
LRDGYCYIASIILHDSKLIEKFNDSGVKLNYSLKIMVFTSHSVAESGPMLHTAKTNPGRMGMEYTCELVMHTTCLIVSLILCLAAMCSS